MRRHWQSWFSGILIVAALVAAILHFGEIERFAELVRQARPMWLLVALALQVSTYVFVALGWRMVLSRSGKAPALGPLVKVAVTKLFADQAMPSGGMSGNVLLVDQLIALGASRGMASAALIVSIVGYYVAYAGCALVALALLWWHHEASMALAIVLTIFLAIASAIIVLVLWLGRSGGGRLANRLRSVKWLQRLFETLAAAPSDLLKDGGLVARVALSNLGVFVADAATLWTCLRAIGYPGAALWETFVALVIGSIVAMMGPIPMGLGTFEASATGSLRLVGVPTEAAFAGVMLLRLYTLWIPLLPGLWMIRRLNRSHAERGKPGA